MKTEQEKRKEYFREHPIYKLEDSNAKVMGRLLRQWREAEKYEIHEIAELIGGQPEDVANAETGTRIDNKKYLSYLLLADFINIQK